MAASDESQTGWSQWARDAFERATGSFFPSGNTSETATADLASSAADVQRRHEQAEAARLDAECAEYERQDREEEERDREKATATVETAMRRLYDDLFPRSRPSNMGSSAMSTAPCPVPGCTHSEGPTRYTTYQETGPSSYRSSGFNPAYRQSYPASTPTNQQSIYASSYGQPQMGNQSVYNQSQQTTPQSYDPSAFGSLPQSTATTQRNTGGLFSIFGTKQLSDFQGCNR
jgi:hypothetical protein